MTEAGTRLQYQVAGEFNSTGQNLIGGLHVTRFGVPMVVVYTRVSQPVVVEQSVVPGAHYDIGVWGISEDNTRRSGEPSRQTEVAEERSKLGGCSYIECEHLWERIEILHTHLGDGVTAGGSS